MFGVSVKKTLNTVLLELAKMIILFLYYLRRTALGNCYVRLHALPGHGS